MTRQATIYRTAVYDVKFRETITGEQFSQLLTIAD
jgi:hypothetical protein